MIRYDLACSASHRFDGWFRSSDDFEAQVEKALMAPAVARRDRGAPAPTAPAEPPAAESAAEQPVALLSEPERQFRELLRAVRAHVVANATDVGERFPEVARQMHYEEVERRSIYGRATPEEAEALQEEGIDFLSLPVLPEDRS